MSLLSSRPLCTFILLREPGFMLDILHSGSRWYPLKFISTEVETLSFLHRQNLSSSFLHWFFKNKDQHHV